MTRPPWIRAAIVAGRPFHHRRKRPVVHNAINLGCFALLALGIVETARLPLAPLLYLPVATICFGHLYFALFILVVHEASHQMFVIARERRRAARWNRRFGWLITAPFGIDYVQLWEHGHRAHHLHPMEAEDPQACSPLVGRALLCECLRILLLPGYVQWRSHRSGAGTSSGCPAARAFVPNRALRIGALLGWVALFAAGAVAGRWDVPVAALLGAQVTAALQQIKIAMEHGGAIASHPSIHLRSRTSHFPLRRLLMPFNISLHFEHHLNASIPWYELERYEHALADIVPAEIQSAVYHCRTRRQKRGRGDAGAP
jgi:fatty acid desaturase